MLLQLDLISDWSNAKYCYNHAVGYLLSIFAVELQTRNPFANGLWSILSCVICHAKQCVLTYCMQKIH